MLQGTVAEALKFDWSGFDPRTSFRCLPAIALPLTIGLAAGHPAAGMIAASGAMSVGFGSFQRMRRSHIVPMLFASAGMSVSTLFGTLAGHSAYAVALTAGLWGFLYGLLTAVGAGTSWAAMQAVIALLVVSAYPVSVGDAAQRAWLMLAGGLLQTLLVAVLSHIEDVREAEGPQSSADTSRGGFVPVLRELKENFTLRSDACRYGLRLAVTLAITAGCARSVHLYNEYWVRMTALIVLKPDFHQTLVRGVALMIGTFAGAGLATAIAATVRPGVITLAVLIVLFAWLCYSLLRVNYASYSICITAYIVFLLAFAGLPEMSVVRARALNTALGGACGLLAYAYRPVRPRRFGASPEHFNSP